MLLQSRGSINSINILIQYGFSHALTLHILSCIIILEVIKMASINMSIRTDSELKAQAEQILAQLGMTMNGTINMFLHQIVRDRAVPLSLSLNSTQTVYADLLFAQLERAAGYAGRNARDIASDMDEIIARAGESDNE